MIDGVAASALADEFGTPLYVYSADTLRQRWQAYQAALPASAGMLCYAVKANSNLTLLGMLADAGAGFDIVSVGELERVLLAGGKPERIVFSGVGKQAHELRRALEVGIHCFNVESSSELDHLEAVARELGTIARVSLRVNPNVDPRTHPYISTGLKTSKFGVAIEEALPLYRKMAASDHLDAIGVDCHIGSQLTDTQPLMEALDSVMALVDRLKAEGVRLQHVDMGGGLGVSYEPGEEAPDIGAYVSRLVGRLEPLGLKLILEPGRSVVADAGVFLTRVELLKTGSEPGFAVVDGAMNDLLRPALYGAWQAVVPEREADPNATAPRWDIVGPVCETGDFLARDRSLDLQEGDLLAVLQAGAYGAVMASNYNTRPRPAEVLVDGAERRLVRRRETLQDVWAHEVGLP